MADNTSDNSPKIECAENGPYIIKGCDRLTDAAGGAIDTKSLMTLCRSLAPTMA